MAVLSTTTKGKLSAKAATQAVKNPNLVRVGARAAKPASKFVIKTGTPLVKRRARKRVVRMGETARTVGVILATYGPPAAQELGLVETPKPKRTAPRLAIGIVIGAAAVYFLEPSSGRAHREQVLRLVG